MTRFMKLVAAVILVLQPICSKGEQLDTKDSKELIDTIPDKSVKNKVHDLMKVGKCKEAENEIHDYYDVYVEELKSQGQKEDADDLENQREDFFKTMDDYVETSGNCNDLPSSFDLLEEVDEGKANDLSAQQLKQLMDTIPDKSVNEKVHVLLEEGKCKEAENEIHHYFDVFVEEFKSYGQKEDEGALENQREDFFKKMDVYVEGSVNCIDVPSEKKDLEDKLLEALELMAEQNKVLEDYLDELEKNKHNFKEMTGMFSENEDEEKNTALTENLNTISDEVVQDEAQEYLNRNKLAETLQMMDEAGEADEHELQLSCDDGKTHAAVGTALLAAGATALGIATGGVAVAATLIAGLATAGNGLTNYITCPGSTFPATMDDIQYAAVTVYKEESDKTAKRFATDYFDYIKVYQPFLFDLETSKLNDLITKADTTYNEALRAPILSTDTRIAITASILELKMLSILKRNTKYDNDNVRCSSDVKGYKYYVKRLKDSIDDVSWENQLNNFKEELTASYRWEWPGAFQCRAFVFVSCEANYGGHSYKLGEIEHKYWAKYQLWCDENKLSVQEFAENKKDECKQDLIRQFKEKFDSWFGKIKTDYEKVIELAGNESEVQESLCGKFVRPLCNPLTFKDGIPEGCCDSNHHKCTNHEGPCNTNDDCADGLNCVTKSSTVVPAGKYRARTNDCKEVGGWGNSENICFSTNCFLPQEPYQAQCKWNEGFKCYQSQCTCGKCGKHMPKNSRCSTNDNCQSRKCKGKGWSWVTIGCRGYCV